MLLLILIESLVENDLFDDRMSEWITISSEVIGESTCKYQSPRYRKTTSLFSQPSLWIII
jgi:hypothetical protein